MTSTVDLFAAGDGNGCSLQQRYDEVRASESQGESDTLGDFADLVLRDGRVGVNMRPYALAKVLGGEPYRNAYEQAETVAARTGTQSEAELRGGLRTWHDPRVAFANAFANGTHFRYGSLNCGGAGVTHFGLFCAILKHWRHPDPADAELCLLPHDSLRRYVDAACSVSIADVLHDVGAWGSRHHVASVKLARSVCHADPSEWSHLVCSDADYMEAIFTAGVTVEACCKIRVDEAEYMRLTQLVVEGAADLPLSADAKEDLDSLASIQEACAKRAIPLRRL